MNYYQYGTRRRTPEKKKASDYIKPFIVLVVFVAIVIAGWKLLSALFGDDEENATSTTTEKVQLEIETGAAKVMASGSEEWKTIPPGGVELFESEKAQTLSDGRLTLNFFDGTVGRLDKLSTVALDRLIKGATEAEIELTLEKGNLWIDKTLPTQLTINTQDFSVKASNEARFSISALDNSLYVLEGDIDVDVLNEEGKVVKTLNVGKNQQMLVTDSAIEDLAKGLNKELIFSLDEKFKNSSWYQWNLQKDGINPEELDTNNGDSEDPDSKDDSKDEEDKGDSDSEDKDDEEDKDNEDGPETPKITSPGDNGSKVTLTKVDQFISGTVSKDTEKVMVNDYTLNQFTPGSGKFTYKASATTIKNLKVGENVFTVTALDKDGNKSSVAKITLVLPQEVYDKAEKQDSDKEESTGGVTITSPNGGKDLISKETNFVISGSVPAKTTVVKVNNYQLQGFSSGASTFKYNTSTAIGNLKSGQKNTYTVEAFDENGNKLGSASINIDLSEGASSSSQTPPETPSGSGNVSLSINIPTTANAYETTLNQITLGGTVTGEPEAVVVNGTKVESYASGDGKWSMIVTLTPGINTFSVYAEKDGQSSAADSVSVTYNQ